MQQHQLGLNFNLKTARGLEQAHEHHTERNFFQGPVEIRFAHSADGRLQLVDAGVGGHPTRLHMQLGHAFVVAPKKGGEVLRQILFVELGQRADDAEVQRDVAPKGGRGHADLDVARVHVGMKKPVAKHLGEEDGDAVAGEFWNVHAQTAQLVHLVDGQAVHALHHHHLGVAIVPKHFGNQHQIEPLHVAPQLGRVGRFAQQVQLVVQVFVELGHHLARFEAFALGRQRVHPTGHHAHEAQVFVNNRQHVGPQHLDRHFASALATVAQDSKVDLGDGGAGHGHLVKLRKNRVQRFAKSAFDGGHGHGAGERRHAVLQVRQLVGNVGRQQVAPGGEHLAEFDEDGA